MGVPLEGVTEAHGDGWKALMFPDRIALAVSPLADNLPRALREMLTPIERRHWMCEWQFVDRLGWDVYHLDRLV